MPRPSASTAIAITNPLHVYRSHVLTKKLLPDPAQHRTALLLQSVYHRLKDYAPPVELDTRLSALSSALSRNAAPPAQAANTSIWSDLRRRSQDRADQALVRVVSSADTALETSTPQGFFLHGEVGTGKSLLLDLLYVSLPHDGKERWHFHAFMLHVYAALAAGSVLPASSAAPWGSEHALLRIARDLVKSSPILFLDEIQFPDRAAAKIVSELLVRFWSLGGVLIGSSNRPPRELVKAAGAGRQGEFRVFEDVFEARCETYRIESQRDWRRARRKGWWRVGVDEPAHLSETESPWEDELSAVPTITEETEVPDFYFTPAAEEEAASQWNAALAKAVGAHEWEWHSSVLTVYGRTVLIPRACNGVALFTFAELCQAALGPADYLAITAQYHTIFIDAVPILSHSTAKNEARRFITLLDAVYESGVRLAIRTVEPVSIDQLFPAAPSGGARAATAASGSPARRGTEYDMTGDSDSLHGEVFAEAYQDTEAPFRPNIALVSERADEAEREQHPGGAMKGLDFGNVAAFTGEDERFAARRAGSRLWEVCARGWWDGVRWAPPRPRARMKVQASSGAVLHEEAASALELDARSEEEDAHKRTLSPFRTHPEPPPMFGAEHFWSVVRWGRRAGSWGKGVDASVGERLQDREERKVEERSKARKVEERSKAKGGGDRKQR